MAGEKEEGGKEEDVDRKPGENAVASRRVNERNSTSDRGTFLPTRYAFAALPQQKDVSPWRMVALSGASLVPRFSWPSCVHEGKTKDTDSRSARG